MVLSVPYHEDDPRSVYKAKKLKASVQIKSLKSNQTGVIKSDPDGKSIEELQMTPTESTATPTYRSHTGHGRYIVSPSVESIPTSTQRSFGSKSSHTIDPSYYTADPPREDRSSIATSRSAPVYSREQSAPDKSVGSSVSDRIAAYRKNAKIVSAPKVSTYSVAVNSDRYVKNPMAPVAPVPQKSLYSGTALSVETASRSLYSGTTPSAETTPRSLYSGAALSVETTPELEAPVPSKFQNVSSPRKGVRSIAAEPSSSTTETTTTKSTESEPLKDEEKFDENLDEAIVQSQEYWSNIKQKQRAKRRMERAQKSLIPSCGGLNDDDSTVVSSSTEMSSESSWNLLDNILIGQKEDDLNLVTKEELLCDFEESGIDKIKEIHQFIKSLAMDDEAADLVGRDIVATDMTTELEEDDSADTPPKEKGLMARFARALAAKVASEGAGDEETLKNTQLNAKKQSNRVKRTTAVHTVKYSPRSAEVKSKTTIATEQYMAAVAASNRSVTSRERIGSIDNKVKNDSSSTESTKELSGAESTKEPSGEESTKEPSGAAPTRDADVESIAMSSAVSSAMVEAGSAASIKSVRFSEKVETHEPEEVKTPDVPSLMDDPGEEDETSVASSPEPAHVAVVVEEKEALKKKGFFKKLLRRAKRKSKKRGHQGPFQPSLETMNEEVEEEDDTFTSNYTRAAESGATETKPSDETSTHEMSNASHASEGFELIAGCTKTGKKAIMIAKAKNERKRRSEDAKPATSRLDPPPSTTDGKKKETTSVVARAQEEKTIDVDDDVHKALNVINTHAGKHGVSGRELMDRVQDGEEKKRDNEDDETIGSFDATDTFASEGDSLYRGDSTVASKLLNMFDTLFATDVGAEDEDTVESASVEE
eukprot:CAMPEP_0113625026 /NCGR_PEP_ID=MMETSP0017_2-20120614/12916_1 /TAXON_ID=2856 /ORGANISM="Cylindrotheca closterium" /LENGTH=878 /DNA_ID=CAMNT_0000535105 /DNA_START=29 /DNA_END=2665 /DNA_ORIENTATION=- /assembly_acc=CAM_ASM_000147